LAKKKLHRRHKLKRPGSAPGTLEYTGNLSEEKAEVIRCIYNEQELNVSAGFDAARAPGEAFTDWIDVKGLRDVSKLTYIWNHFSIHSLIQEDILNVYQRARLEELSPGYFITFKALKLNLESETQVEVQQVSIYYQNNTILTFQELPDDLFISIRQRLEKAGSRIRSGGAFYLLYALIDFAIDNYIDYYHHLDQATEQLEEQVESFDQGNFKLKAHHLKMDILQLRRVVFPLREVLSKLTRMALEDGRTDKLPYIKDLSDHLILLLEDIDECKDRLNALQDLYNIHLQLKTNQVVQTLTIISTIFIPITFVAGVYGMNFENMPELGWKHGYISVLFLMLFMAISMLLYFKRKRWF
jgi:magnesium transporter